MRRLKMLAIALCAAALTWAFWMTQTGYVDETGAWRPDSNLFDHIMRVLVLVVLFAGMAISLASTGAEHFRKDSLARSRRSRRRGSPDMAGCLRNNH